MGLFVLYYRGGNAPTDQDLDKIQAERGITIIDQKIPKTLLVKGDKEVLRKLLSAMPGWTIAPLRKFYPYNP